MPEAVVTPSQDHSRHCDSIPGKVILIFGAFVLPPLPIFLLQDYSIFTKEFLVAVILTVLGHIPGTIYAVFFILVEYPRYIANTRNEAGYRRVPDDEEALLNAEESTSHEDDPPSGAIPVFGISLPQQHEQPKVDQQFQESLVDTNEGLPPSYEAIAGPSTAPVVSDSKSEADNKVQHN
ncbi:uncharacterized protein RJT20DRAFT_137088 [Scheffersomyces xylosifermentans]|uniref:uncharacterized protein n=1 Tax=Scheffersomyces xylosifermentans TaxID=1304137 RepID=UPI00315CE2DA